MTRSERSVFCNVEHPKTPLWLRPHSKTRQKLRERLMREQVDHRIEERRQASNAPDNASSLQMPK